MRILLTVLLFSGLFSAPLSAAVVTNLDKPLSIVASVGNISGVNHRAANGFILNETSILQSATLRMFSTQGITTANFTLDLYSATATKPDSLLASFSGETNPDASDFVYTIDNYLIEAGTEYFLVASALNQSEGDYFVWSGTNTLTETGDGIISDVIYGSSDMVPGLEESARLFFLLTLHHKPQLFQSHGHSRY